MSEWRLQIPGADDQTLSEALGSGADEAIEDAEDRRVTQQLFFDVAGQATTVGDLRRQLGTLSPDDRRVLLDRAREGAGLESTAKVEAHRAFEAANAGGSSEPLRDSMGRVLALCAEPNCGAFLHHEQFGGEIRRVNVQRWWCSEHVAGHEADMEPYDGQARLTLSMTGKGFRFPEEDQREAQRRRNQDESLRHQREAERARRRGDGERIAKLERGHAERMRAEHIKVPGSKP